MERALQELVNPLLLSPAGPWISWAGTRPATLLYALAALGWMSSRAGLRPFLAPALLALGLTELTVNHGWKPLFERPRPCAEQAHLWTAPPEAPRRCGDDPSFPSGHAATTAAIAAASGSPPLYAVSLLVGGQRVVTAQHHPTDVAAGWLWGGALGWLGRRLWRRWRPAPTNRG